MYDSIVNLPVEQDFISAITGVALHPKFSIIESNANKIVESIPAIEKLIGGAFDINKLFSGKLSNCYNVTPKVILYFFFIDDQIFSNSGNILCGKPFPRSDNIRFVENILYTEDLGGPNDDEINSMPSLLKKNYFKIKFK